MKKLALFILFICLHTTLLFAQKQDSLDIEMKKTEIELKRKEVEMKQQELIIKQQEYDMLRENSLEAKEEKKEIKAMKQKREKTEAEKDADKKARMNKNTVITFKPMALIIGGLDLGIEKRVSNRVGLKLMAGYYYSENVNYYNNRGYNNNYNNQDNYISYGGNKSAQQTKVELLAKFYLSPKSTGLNGLYIAPSFQYKQLIKNDYYLQNVKVPYTYTYYNNQTQSNMQVTDFKYESRRFEETSTAQTATIGLVMGYQIAYSPIVIDINFAAGLGIPLNNYDSDNFNVPILQGYNKGARPRIGFNIGVPF